MTHGSTATPDQQEPLLRLQGITRSFGKLRANDDISFDVQAGTVHAVLGENGAGKSTLMSILAGSLRPDAGHVVLDGKPVEFDDPTAALAAGIGMVHQHFQLVPTMTVAENILLNDEPTRLGLLRQKEGRADVARLLKSMGVDAEPETRVEETSVSAQQKIEVLKVLRRRVRLLILDEPTASLAPQEAHELLQLVQSLSRQGTTVLLISHKLDEVLEVADYVTVLRSGKVVADEPAAGLTAGDLARLMVGRDVLLSASSDDVSPGREILRLRRVSLGDGADRPSLVDVDLSCFESEILGVAGVDGNGQTELVEVLAGLRAVRSGEFFWSGEAVTIESPVAQIRRGISYIPEDRQVVGLSLASSVRDNLILRKFRDGPYSRRGVLQRDAVNDHATAVIDAYGIRANSGTLAGQLSGGNQQKIVVGRELAGSPSLVIAVQPTRGIDVGASQFVYDQLLDLRRRGGSVLLVSHDLDEILTLSDRIVVLYGGRLVATIPRREATREVLGAYMTGAVTEQLATGTPGTSE